MNADQACVGLNEVLDRVDGSGAARQALAGLVEAGATDPATGLLTWPGLRARLERLRPDVPVWGAVVHVEVGLGPSAPSADRILSRLGESVLHRLPRASEVARLDDRELVVVVPGEAAGLVDPTIAVRAAASDLPAATGVPASAVTCAPLAPGGVGALLGQVRRVQTGLVLGSERRPREDEGDPGTADPDGAASVFRDELLRAVDDDEFRLVYQPVVDASGAVTAVEALLRWDSPSGARLPASFLPAAERAGVDVELGRWVLRRAVADAARWMRAGMAGVPVVVNVTPAQLASDRLPDDVAELLRGAGAPGLVIETALRADDLDLRNLVGRLEDLRSAGARLSLDRVDRSAVSAGLLRALPLMDSVKLDRAVVADLAGSGRATAAALGIIARRSGAHLGATGVETDGEFGALRELGIDLLQGYRFCPPVEPEELDGAAGALRPPAAFSSAETA